eukprot:1227524-Pleurochrysis_carterae.AAC.1
MVVRVGQRAALIDYAARKLGAKGFNTLAPKGNDWHQMRKVPLAQKRAMAKSAGRHRNNYAKKELERSLQIYKDSCKDEEETKWELWLSLDLITKRDLSWNANAKKLGHRRAYC